MLNLLEAGYCKSLSPVHSLRRAAGTARPDSPAIASINVGRYLGGSDPQLAHKGHRRCTFISGASYRPRESSDMPTQVLSPAFCGRCRGELSPRGPATTGAGVERQQVAVKTGYRVITLRAWLLRLKQDATSFEQWTRQNLK